MQVPNRGGIENYKLGDLASGLKSTSNLFTSLPVQVSESPPNISKINNYKFVSSPKFYYVLRMRWSGHCGSLPSTIQLPPNGTSYSTGFSPNKSSKNLLWLWLSVYHARNSYFPWKVPSSLIARSYNLKSKSFPLCSLAKGSPGNTFII